MLHSAITDSNPSMVKSALHVFERQKLNSNSNRIAVKPYSKSELRRVRCCVNKMKALSSKSSKVFRQQTLIEIDES